MKSLTYSDLVKAKELDDLFLSGDTENGKRMHYGIMSNKHIQKMIFPNLGDISCHVTQGATFENVVFNETQFLGADLSATIFKNCIFNNCSLVKSDLISSQFYKCIFSNCNLSKAKFLRTTIENCLIVNCNLNRMSLSNSKIHNTIIQGHTAEPLIGDNEEENVIWNLTKPAVQKV